MLDGLQNGQKSLCSLESRHFFNVSKPVRDPPKMPQPLSHAARQMMVDSGLRDHHPLRDLTERKKRCLRKHRRDPIVKSEIPFKVPDDKRVFIFWSTDEFSNIFSSCRISDCILPEYAVDFMRDRKFVSFGILEEGDDGMEVNYLISTYRGQRFFLIKNRSQFDAE
jgi:hypothetical protein